MASMCVDLYDIHLLLMLHERMEREEWTHENKKEN